MFFFGQKAKKKELEKYVSDIKSGKIEGDFASPLCLKKYEEYLQDVPENEWPEFRRLYFDGKPTKLSSCNLCDEQSSIFTGRQLWTIALSGSRAERAQYIKQHIAGHRHDFSSQPEPVSRKRKNQSNDETVNSKKRKKITKDDLEELEKAILEFISDTNASLSVVDKPSFRRLLLGAARYFGTNVKERNLPLSARTLGRRLAKNSKARVNQLKSLIVPLIDAGANAAIIFDHKHTGRLLADKGKDCLGVLLSVCSIDGRRRFFPLAFQHAAFKDQETTTADVREVLTRYGLLERVERGIIPICTDGALIKAAKALSPITELCDFCGAHNFDRILKNTIEAFKNSEYKSDYEKLEKFFNTAPNDVSRVTAKKQRMTARGFNSYLENKTLTDEDILSVARFRKGWKACFEKNNDELTPDEADEKQKLLSRIDQLPVIKKICSVRFRSHHENFESAMILIPIIREAQKSPNHPVYRWCSDVKIPLIEALYKVFKTLENALSDMEKDINLTGGLYSDWIDHLLKQSTVESECPITNKLNTCLQLVIMQQLTGGHYFDEDGIKKKSDVPKRMTKLQAMALFLSYPHRKAPMKGARRKMAKKSPYNANLLRDSLNEDMNMAKESIKELSDIVNIDEPTAGVVKSTEKDPYSEDDDSDVDSEDENEQSNPLFPPRASSSSSVSFHFKPQIERELEAYESMQYSEYAQICSTAGIEEFDSKSMTRTSSMPENSTVFWKSMGPKWPHLSRVALLIMKAPASSSSIERLFSQMSQTTSTKRASLLAKTVEQLHQSKSSVDDFFEHLDKLSIVHMPNTV